MVIGELVVTNEVVAVEGSGTTPVLLERIQGGAPLSRHNLLHSSVSV